MSECYKNLKNLEESLKIKPLSERSTNSQQRYFRKFGFWKWIEEKVEKAYAYDSTMKRDEKEKLFVEIMKNCGEISNQYIKRKKENTQQNYKETLNQNEKIEVNDNGQFLKKKKVKKAK